MRSQSQNRLTSDLPRRRQVRQLLMIKNRKAAWPHLTLSGNHLQDHRGAVRSTAAYILREATMNEEMAKRLALGMAILCVRNTCIEDLHAGIEPSSQAGDFSDVKVVTPYGEIPWNKLSRIRDDDMRDFMKQVVDRIYTVLLRLDDPEFVERMDNYARRTTAAWDIPNNLANWFTGR